MNDNEILLWLASREGLRLEPYIDPNGTQWNIGFGHYLGPVNRKAPNNGKPKLRRIKTEEAWRILKADYNMSLKYADAALKREGVKPKNPTIRPLLAMTVFNAGPNILRGSTFRQAARKGEAALLQWPRNVATVNGVPNADLLDRRTQEMSWATDPKRWPLPVSNEIRNKYKGLFEVGPTPTPTPVPQDEFEGKAPGARLRSEDVAQAEEQPKTGISEKFKPGLMNPLEVAWEPVKRLWKWLADSNREQAEKLAQKYGVEIATLDGENVKPTAEASATPAPKLMPPRSAEELAKVGPPNPYAKFATPKEEPTAAPAQEESADDILAGAGMEKPQGGRPQPEGEQAIPTAPPEAKSDDDWGMPEKPPATPEEEDAAYQRWLRKTSEDERQELKREAKKYGSQADELRKKLLNRKNIEYEKLYE